MSNARVLRTYAQMAEPARLPPSVLFDHSETCLTVYDVFPKAIFHFLVLPRVRSPMRTGELSDLRALLRCDRDAARCVLRDVHDEAERVKKAIQEEMLKRYGFRWEIWTGFHPIPSMDHLHLHVISSDLCSPRLKTKKHYNSFHPKVGFFLPLSDVLSWFDAHPSYFEMISQLKKTDYEPRLKEELACWRCGGAKRNMPMLKAHLQEEWDNEACKAKTAMARKRKREESQVSRSPSAQRGTDGEQGSPAKTSGALPDEGSTAL